MRPNSNIIMATGKNQDSNAVAPAQVKDCPFEAHSHSQEFFSIQIIHHLSCSCSQRQALGRASTGVRDPYCDWWRYLQQGQGIFLSKYFLKQKHGFTVCTSVVFEELSNKFKITRCVSTCPPARFNIKHKQYKGRGSLLNHSISLGKPQGPPQHRAHISIRYRIANNSTWRPWTEVQVPEEQVEYLCLFSW